jgi:hypothetical protein
MDYRFVFIKDKHADLVSINPQGIKIPAAFFVFAHIPYGV